MAADRIDADLIDPDRIDPDPASAPTFEPVRSADPSPAPRSPRQPGLGSGADPAMLARLATRITAGPDAVLADLRSPLNRALLAELPMSTVEDVETAFRHARQAQAVWAERSLDDRAAVLMRTHDLLLERRSEGIDILQLESGKARLHAFEELADVAINARWYARRGPRLLRDVRRSGLVPGLTAIRQVRHPKGVVAVIAPWNYPLILSVSDALPALLAGNAIVLKPAQLTPLTALWAADVLAEAGLPEGLLQVVHGAGSVVGTAMIDRCDYLCFTGSTSAGRAVATRAAARLVGASLELGGKNALYVAEDADLDRAAEGAVRDCFSNAGQACVSIERMILHQDIADSFLDRFLDRVRRLRVGARLDYSTDVGSLVSAEHLAEVDAFVQDAVANGAKVLTGGRARPDLGPFCYEPTVLADVTAAARCHLEETFGPVVSVYRVGSDAEALSLANLGEYGLNGTVWTREVARGRRLARQIRAGTVAVNEAFVLTWASVGSPMGGMKESGLGRRHGDEGLLRFTETQTIAAQRAVGLGPLYAGGGERVSTLLTKALQAARVTRFPWP